MPLKASKQEDQLREEDLDLIEEEEVEEEGVQEDPTEVEEEEVKLPQVKLKPQPLNKNERLLPKQFNFLKP